ncbi:MAG: YibE/F family protein [Clostridia bacterium]|nr:YibE/F family protein [Clostridia bacterium]
MKNRFANCIGWLKRPATWIAAALVVLIAVGFAVSAVNLRRPVAMYNKDRDDAAQVYFTHLALAADASRVLFENGALPDGMIEDDSLSKYTAYAHAKVVEVLEDNTYIDESTENARVGDQTLLLEITTGEHKGRRITTQFFMGKMFDKHAEEGTSLLVSVMTDPRTLGEDGLPKISVTLMNYDRTRPILLIVALFLLVTGLIGGKVGLRSILGLAFTLAAVVLVLIPALLRGHAPVPLTLGVCALVTVVCFILLDGLNRKTLSAMLGTIAGFCLAALFAAFASALTKLDGLMYYSSETSNLIDAQYQGVTIQIRGLFVSGIIISALGAVMDVAMSISSSINELKTVNPGMRFFPLLKSGMRIGRDAIGTMTNTLILAFTGGALTELLLMKIFHWDFKAILSGDYITHEIITGVSGSIGLILAVPLTALIASALCETRIDEVLLRPVKLHR